MGTTAMTPTQNPVWKPDAHDAEDMQGIIVSAYPKMFAAMLLMVKFTSQPGGHPPDPKGWLRDIVVRVTDARKERARERTQCINLALSAAGLRTLGLDNKAMLTFSLPFQQGMTFGDRPRFLGDSDTPVRPIWEWSDNEDDTNCVHAQLMLYAVDQEALSGLVKEEAAIVARFGLTVVNKILQQVKLDKHGMRHEHFGFADGISQPVLVDGKKIPVEKRALHEIAAGEIVLGQIDSYGDPSPGPVVGTSAAATRNLQPVRELTGFFDLGRNGTYVVIRQLKQDVAAFWNNMRDAAKGLVDENGKPARDEWLATKSVGRTLAGEMLTPEGPAAGNDMTFFAKDRAGFGCPVTSHVRRANPRDGLAPTEGDTTAIIQAANHHRIVRRGRIYGEPISDRYDKSDRVDRGLVFVCLNSEIERQFEFVQHTWLLNQMFGGEFEQSDPLTGPKCPFSIPSLPVRQQPVLETFITARGGGYFFLPSLSALRYLGEL
jgi:Dyp-type peroxidase family